MTRDERQQVGLQKWMKYNCRATLMWATGTGKTVAAIKAIKLFLTKNENKVITVIVPSEYLKLQWLQKLFEQGLIPQVSVEIINSAINKSTQIDFIILDEVHRMASTFFYLIFKQRNPKIILGLSATFNRLDGKHELLNEYCPVCDVITVREAIENDWLSSYREYKVVLQVDDFSVYQEKTQEFFSTFAYFGNNFTTAMNCVAGVKKGNKVVVPAHIVRYKYAESLCTLDKYHPDYRNVVNGILKEVTAVAFSWNRALQARKEFVMNHPKKIEIARKILQARPQSKAITFSATIKQAEKIKIGMSLHSGKTKAKNKITMEEFLKLPYGVLNTSKSLDQGADIPGLNLAVILSNSSSSLQKTQRIGRVLRLEEGKQSEVFTLVIKDTNEEHWYNNSTEGKEYLEITEAELDSILRYEKLEKTTQEGYSVDPLFRF